MCASIYLGVQSSCPQGIVEKTQDADLITNNVVFLSQGHNQVYYFQINMHAENRRMRVAGLGSKTGPGIFKDLSTRHPTTMYKTSLK